MIPKYSVAVFLLFLIDAIDLTPLNNNNSRNVSRYRLMQVRKRDVGSLFARNNDENNSVNGEDAEIEKYVYHVAPNDNYYFYYKQSDGQEREETGIFEYDAELNMRKLKATGYYVYTRPDNVKQRVDYVSDDQGFAPSITES